MPERSIAERPMAEWPTPERSVLDKAIPEVMDG